jgi:cell division protein FtsI (penicillin-binding protein 3)
LIGRLDGDGRPLDGLELTLDSVLRGENGMSRLVKGVRGRTFVSPTQPGLAPRQGHTVVLTINHELQEIAERTLADAIARMGADGGDIVILDPRGGEVLAMAGQRSGVSSPSATAVTEPFEPGSTLKPLIAAGLLSRGKARTTDMVPTRGGSYELHGRTVNDEPHERGGPTPARLSLADVIRYSSNVGIVQFAERFSEREEFETLRDFGLGTPTGLAYSSEAAGTLRPPRTWSRQTQASLAMGYEVAVTPLQLALAYAALANGGELLEPVLVKEIRTHDGEVRYRHQRRVVRRVVSEKVASTVRGLLSGVVETGTAVDADLATYRLAGKTGTPRRTMGGRYAPQHYNPNFVGIFPADKPQLVVVVKLSSPKGTFYGGRTAAPMTKTILEAALAARDAALDRSELRPRARVVPAVAQAGRARTPVATARRAAVAPARADTGTRSVVISLINTGGDSRPSRAPKPVPNVTGMSLRDAVRSLHFAGFRVQLIRSASSTSVTEPASGAVTSAGALVRLRYTR